MGIKENTEAAPNIKLKHDREQRNRSAEKPN